MQGELFNSYNKDRFEQTYNTYHNLGANGVMDATREKIHKLPISLGIGPKKRQGAILKFSSVISDKIG